MADYPLITSALNERDAARFDEALKSLESAKEAGGIALIRFNEAKTTINRCLEKAWEKLVLEAHTWHGKWQSLPQEVRDLEMSMSRPAAHLLKGQLAKVEKRKGLAGDPCYDAMHALLTEAQPLGDLVNALKGMIVKREPKPVEDRKAKYLAPPATAGAMQSVHKTLTEITKDSRAALVDNIVARFNRYLEKFLEAQKEAAEAGKNLKPYDYYRGNHSRINMEAYEVVSGATKTTGVGGRTDPVEVRPDAQQTFRVRAEKIADEICEEFVVKNLAKLDSILERKGDFQSAKVLSTSVRYGLEGRLRFTFTDGAEFTVMLQAVDSYSKHGTWFLRFPVTFHDVKMSDGSKMKTPNEQKMNTIFVEG